MRVVAAIVPGAVPEILGNDRESGCFAMAFLAAQTTIPVWKALLQDGDADPSTAAAVGDVLGRIHAATADRPDIAARFPTDAIFHTIRLEPYLVATGRAHPDLRSRFDELVATTRTTRRVLVHGDFSPKNILCGPAGPVIVDAECAWFGDPAFDLAFVPQSSAAEGRVAAACAARATSPPSTRWPPPTSRTSGGRWPRLEARAARCCPRCCWRASTASRRSNT